MKLFVGIVILLILITISAGSFAASYQYDIEKFCSQNKILEKKIFEELRFKLADFQPVLGGHNAKCILESNDARLWFFKIEEEIPQFLNLAYRWHWLCGDNIPAIYNIRLSINGELKQGLIQEFIADAKTLENIPISLFSQRQIEYIQKQQIIDWLLFSRAFYESSDEQFLLKGEEIISVEKSGIFTAANGQDILDDNFKQSADKNNYYEQFWQAYLHKEIDVDFNKSFELIDYIQNLDDEFIKKFFKPVVKQNFDLNRIIGRKHQLRVYFERYYRYMADKRGENAEFEKISMMKSGDFTGQVVKKLKRDIRKKETILKKLKIQNLKPQTDIGVVMSARLGEISDGYGYPENFSCNQILHFKNKLEELKNKINNSNEKLALHLFLYHLEYLSKGITEENFFEIKPFRIYSPRTIDIQEIESCLRVTAYAQEGFWIDSIGELVADKREIDYVLYVLAAILNFDNYEQIKKYGIKFINNQQLQEILNSFLAMDFSSSDNLLPVIARLNKLDDSKEWKHFFLAFSYYHMAFWHNDLICKNKAAAELRKLVRQTDNEELLYASYLFLGYLYEHNENCCRFKKGFNLNKAIGAYRKASLIKPNSVAVHLNLAELYLLKRLPDKAWKHYKAVLNINSKYFMKHYYFEKDFLKEFNISNRSKKIEMLRYNSLDGWQSYIVGLVCEVKGLNNLAGKYFSRAESLGYFE